MKKNAINNKSKSNSCVKVIVRVRPLIALEQGTVSVVEIGQDEQSVKIQIDQYNSIETKFDKTLSEFSNQNQVFENIRPFIQQVTQAYNLTIFAYGQTGSGKTFTIFGKDWQKTAQEPPLSKKDQKKQHTPTTDLTIDNYSAGIIPRTCDNLFRCLKPIKSQFNVFCSFLQVYNEKIYDLLNDSPLPSALTIRESKKEGLFVEGLGQFHMREYSDCIELMQRGEKNRKVRHTHMNTKSSRSHTIFKLLLQPINTNSLHIYSKSSVSLCDLAGSQKINKNQKMNNQHFEELKCINLSLTTLGKVIYSLSKGVPKNSALFRESKMTRLLQESLIGNSNTLIIGTISPSSKNIDETVSTLKFVERAQHIKLTVKQNYLTDQNSLIIAKLQQQMQQLKKMLRDGSRTVPQEISLKLNKLEIENQKLKGEALSKEESIRKLMRNNENMRKALTAEQRVELEEVEISSEESSASREEPPVNNRQQDQNNRQFTIDNEQSVGNNEQQGIKSTERTINRYQAIEKKGQASGNRQPVANSRQRAVSNRLPVIENKQRSIDNKQPAVKRRPVSKSQFVKKKGQSSEQVHESPNHSYAVPPGLPQLSSISPPRKKSFNNQQSDRKPAMAKLSAKNRIISRLQNLESYQKNNENKLIRDLQYLEQQEERKKAVKLSQRTSNRSFQFSHINQESSSNNQNKSRYSKIDELELEQRK